MGKQLRIHILGAHETNAPWAFELKVAKGFRELGHRVALTDYRKHRPVGVGYDPARSPQLALMPGGAEAVRLWEKRMGEILRHTPADLVLICRGEMFPRWVLEENKRSPVALWCCESLGDPEMGPFNLAQLYHLLPVVDHLFLHEPSLSFPQARIAPCACVDPEWVMEMRHLRNTSSLTRIDVLFNGTMTRYRRQLLDDISHHLSPYGVQITETSTYGPAMALDVMRSRLVLNLHLGPVLNTETRVAEVLGLGVPLLSQRLSVEEFANRVEQFGTPRDAIYCILDILQGDGTTRARYRKHEELYSWIMDNHTFARRCEEILQGCGLGS